MKVLSRVIRLQVREDVAQCGCGAAPWTIFEALIAAPSNAKTQP